MASLSSIRPANAQDFENIRHIAAKAWQVAYKGINSPEFMAHELKREYSDTALNNQMMVLKHRFLILENASAEAIGFVSYSVDNSKAVVHKLYLLPDVKGQGHGTLLMKQAEGEARKSGCETMELLVNRLNTAVSFYQKQGYAIAQNVDSVVGEGFVRSDYLMRKIL
jgi:GNAT superfamily N-acetyltransferase